MEWLTEPLSSPIMRDAYLIAALVAVPTALLSCFLILKGWSLMGDAVSHAVFPGIVLAYAVGLPLALGAFLAGMAAALMTGYFTENSKIKEDTVIGIVFSGMFGLGLVLFAKVRTNLHLDHILFGNLLGITPYELWLAGVIGVSVTAILVLRWRDVMLYVFDPIQAQTLGLPIRAIHYGLLITLSLCIVSTLQATGIILAVGLLISPGAIAFLVTRRFSYMLMAAVGISLFAGWAGITASYWLNSAPAPTIILVLSILFIAAFTAKATRQPV